MSKIITCPNCGQKNRIEDHANIHLAICAKCKTRLNQTSNSSTQSPDSEEDIEDIQKLYAAALGKTNHIYYLEKFKYFDQHGSGLQASWNWPALFIPAWSLYRKMYKWFFVLCGMAFLANIFDKAGSPVLWGIFLLVPNLIFAIYANSLYHHSIKKKIAKAKITVKDQSKLLSYLRHKGGVNAWVIWIPIISFVAMIIIGFAYNLIGNQTKHIPTDTEISTSPSINTINGNTDDTDNTFGFYFENKCIFPVSLFLRYEGPDGIWHMDGGWNVNGLSSGYLKDQYGNYLKTNNAVWYYYAVTTDSSNLEWRGEHFYEYEGILLPMIELEDEEGDINWSISCQ